MAQEQTALINEPIEVLVNVIGSSGAHEAATINTTTTRIDGYPSTAPTVTTVSTGIYKISFSGVTPAPAEGDRLTVKVNGTVTSTSTAWSEYGIPVKILAEERGTDNASTFDASSDAVTTDAASRTASQADVSSLATAASIAALNDFDPASDTVANVTNTANVTNAVETDAASRNASKADVSGLSTFDASSDQVVASNMRGTDNALLASNAPTNFGLLGINGSGHVARVTLVDTTTTNTDMVDVSSLATSADLATVDNVVDAIKIVTDRLDTALVVDGAVYQFTTNALENAPSGSGGGGDSKEDIYNYFTSSSRQDTFKADVTGLSTFDASTDQVTASNMRGTDNALLAANTPTNFAGLSINSSGHINRVVLVDTTTANSDMVDISSLATSAEIAALNDPSSADIADAVWDELQSSHTTVGSFGYYLDSQVSSAGAGGSGLYQVTVTVQNESAEVLQGARVNVDGTTLTLATDSSGQCVFNLDSGVYTLHVSPPAGYQTPTGNVITVATADISSTFTLAATTPSGDCDVPWVG